MPLYKKWYQILDDRNYKRTKKENQAIGAEIELENNETITIFSIYCPPSNQLNIELLDLIASKYKNSIILGDLNAKHRRWHCSKDDPKGKHLAEFTDANNLIVLNNKTPTNTIPKI